MVTTVGSWIGTTPCLWRDATRADVAIESCAGRGNIFKIYKIYALTLFIKRNKFEMILSIEIYAELAPS